jgi:uncharacterized protein YbjT (DUF2867 family)
VNLVDSGAEIVACDLNDQEGVTSALAGAGAVYYCSPLPIGYDQPFTVERSWGRNAINAAQSAGVEHFVLLSAAGPEKARGVVLIETKRAIERDLAASGLAYTILRPSMFMDNVAMAGPEALLAVGLAWPFSDVVGPEALTFPKIADGLGRAMAAEVRFTEISDEVFTEHVGAAMGSDKVAEAIAAAYRLWERDGSGTGDPSILESEFDISLTRFEDYATGLVETWKRERLI